jgi:hypothetical protein
MFIFSYHPFDAGAGFQKLSCKLYSVICLGLNIFHMTIFTAALLKIQKERQERRAKEEEERRERERQEAEELVRKMHEEACDEPPPIGASLSLSEGHIESEMHMDSAASYMSPVSVVRNVHRHTLDC